MSYDPSNIFARILRGEIPCKKVFESEHVLAFHDIGPKAPHHILVIPKGAYVSAQDFGEKASAAETQEFFQAIAKISADIGIAAGGYRLISNAGENANQEVPHFHMHILGGAPLGPMICRPA
ncbi:histidine triad nucleotide-binding protein [Lacibacterium aquatile]|uniref:Histidine triad nucleotide-binding protein n=1 Tax=Lacibacterium aquatile TaxID=1168082 RepID=A0ABW5DV44_9PROT